MINPRLPLQPPRRRCHQMFWQPLYGVRKGQSVEACFDWLRTMLLVMRPTAHFVGETIL